MTRGLFVSLDGIDGCGKSTQSRLLADWLVGRGLNVVACRDPGGTPLGDELRTILLQSRGTIGPTAEALLFMASRAQLVDEVIRPALGRGDVVVSDRFLLANVAYQGHGCGLDVGRLWEVGRMASGDLEPDLALVLDLSPEEAAARRDRPADRMESRGADFLDRVRRGFLAEARRRPERIKVVDAGGPPEVVQALIRQEVEHVLAARPRS
jgi:dTMP kinase